METTQAQETELLKVAKQVELVMNKVSLADDAESKGEKEIAQQLYQDINVFKHELRLAIQKAEAA